MRISHIPDYITTAAWVLLSPYAQEPISQEDLINALRAYDSTAVQDNAPCQLLKISEAADFLNVTTRTVYALIDQGKLKRVKIGRAARITEQSLQVFIQQQLEGGPP